MIQQLNIFLLLFGVLQGALLGALLFRKKTKNLSFIYLVLILTVAGLQMTSKVLSKVWMYDHIPIAYLMSYKLPFLMGPLLFLFIKSHVKKEFDGMDVLHFIPFVLLSLALFFPTLPGTHLFGFSIYGETLLKVMSLLIYACLSWKLSKGNDQLRKYLPLIGGITITELAVIAGIAFLYLQFPVYQTWRFLFVPLTLFVYWMSYKIMAEPAYFFNAGGKVTSLFRPAAQKYSNSGLKEEEAQRIYSDLQIALKENKAFLDTALTIEKLARQLNTSRHHLSQVINMQLNKTYGEVINDHRLMEVQQRLANPKMKNFTIAAIALDCGFNSVSGFNEIFKKKLGITPSKYREDRLHEMTA